MTVDADRFRSVLGRFASGVTVLAARDAAGRDHGMTVSAFSSVSLEPPLVLVCVGHDASMHPVMAAAERFGVSVLAESQEPLARHFADREVDRWAGVPMRRAPGGTPFVDGAIATLDCRVVARHEAGDHTVVIGRVEEADVGEGVPLVYWRGGYAELRR